MRSPWAKHGASEEVRTLDVHLGKVVLYQLSYARLLKIGKTVVIMGHVNPVFEEIRKENSYGRRRWKLFKNSGHLDWGSYPEFSKGFIHQVLKVLLITGEENIALFFDSSIQNGPILGNNSEWQIGIHTLEYLDLICQGKHFLQAVRPFQPDIPECLLKGIG